MVGVLGKQMRSLGCPTFSDVMRDVCGAQVCVGRKASAPLLYARTWLVLTDGGPGQTAARRVIRVSIQGEPLLWICLLYTSPSPRD
eukprot:11332280-Alexandrium_andersonii.AAC.1